MSRLSRFNSAVLRTLFQLQEGLCTWTEANQASFHSGPWIQREAKKEDPKKLKKRFKRPKPNDKSPQKYPFLEFAKWRSFRMKQVELFSARNWRAVESLLLRDVEEWKMEDLRFAWKRCVLAHLDDDNHQLRHHSPSLKYRGRQFLSDLVKTTLFKLQQTDGQLTGKQARDIGWAAGKQWFMDHQLVDPIERGVLRGVENGEIELVECIPVAWAIANSGQYPNQIFSKLEQDMEYVNSSFNLQHCTNVLWSMGVCGHHPGDEFLQTIAHLASELLIERPETIIPQAIADLMWSLGRLNFIEGNGKLIHRTTEWAYSTLESFSPEELLTMGMGLAMMNSLGIEDLRKIATAFRVRTKTELLDVYVDQFVALTLLFPLEHRIELHQIAFGEESVGSVLAAHHDRQAQIAMQMKSNKFLQLISRQLDKVAEGKYEIGVLTEDRNLALEILVHGENGAYSVIPVYPMSRSRNQPEIELGEVRIAQQLIEAQGIKFGGFLEWIRPEEVESSESDEDTFES